MRPLTEAVKGRKRISSRMSGASLNRFVAYVTRARGVQTPRTRSAWSRTVPSQTIEARFAE